MRYKVIQKNDGPFRMYQVVDTDYNEQVIITSSDKAEADSLCELQNDDQADRGLAMMQEQEDSRKFRRETKKRGQFGTDWYKFYNGVPPEDDDDDYEWSGSQWHKIWRE